jgi:hypothetical protein
MTHLRVIIPQGNVRSQSAEGMVKYIGGDIVTSGRRFGLLMVVLGIFLILDRIFPFVSQLTNALFPWPFILILFGLILLMKNRRN